MRAVERSPRSTASQVVEDACQAHGATRDGVRAGTRRAGRRVQLLSGEEPRRVRRRRRARHGRRADCGTRPCAARARPAREVRARARGLDGAPRLDPGARAAAQAAAARRLERRNGERRRPCTTHAAGRSRRSRGCRPSRRAASRSGTCSSSRTANPTRSQSTSRAIGIGTGRHYPEPCHLTAAYAWLGYQPGSFPVAESASRSRRSRCRSSRASRDGRDRACRRGDRGVTSAVADGPSTTRPTG